MEIKLLICILCHLSTFEALRFGPSLRHFNRFLYRPRWTPNRFFRPRFNDYRSPFYRSSFNFFDIFAKAQRAFRNFGDTLEDCREVERRSRNFCTTHPSKELFEFRRPVSGICNNLLPGKATVGAADTQVTRLVQHSKMVFTIMAKLVVTQQAFACSKSTTETLEKAAKYFDRDGLDTPLGHPSLADVDETRSVQEISDLMLDVTFTDLGNNKRVSPIFMTFGQFMDHDFAYVIHGPTSVCPETCGIEEGAFDYPCNNIKRASKHSQCVRFVRSFAVCQRAGPRQVREQPNNITHYVDGSMIYGSSEGELEQLRNGTSALMKVLKTGKGDLLPLNFNNNEDCQERGGCFLAGDRRVNENTALASMHTVWVRLHNFYAQFIRKIFHLLPQLFKSASLSEDEKDEVIFQESRKIVIAVVQHIYYDEWLPQLNIALPQYKGYNPHVEAEVSNGFITAAFRFGHTLVPNFFSQLNPDFTKARRPLSVRESFFNNIPIFRNGIEETLRGLFGDQEEAENFDTTFSGSIAKTLFIPPSESGFQNLLALNIQRGRDHGLPSYSEYRKACGIPDASPSSYNPFSIYRNEITNTRALERLRHTYGSPDSHVDLFVAGMAESVGSSEFLGPTFKCIIRNTLEKLRDGDRFFFQNKFQFSIEQQEEVKKMTLAKVMCLTLRDSGTIQENLFDVFNPRKEQRKNCGDLLKNSLDVKRWLLKSVYHL